MKNDRLFQIIYILLEKKTITAPELASVLEVSVRTIYRDIDTLSASGIPVYALSGKNGGISLMPGYTFDKALLSEAEQEQILFALQSMKATGQNVNLLLSKLGTVFKKANKNWIEVDFSRWGLRKTDTVKFETIKKSILEKRILQISYAGSYGETTERNVKPIRLIFKSKNWYMQGYCLKAQAFRTFKITRVLSLAITDESFDDEFNEIPSIENESVSMSNVIELKLRFSPKLLFRVYDEFPNEYIEKQIDGSVIVTAYMPADSWIYSYILSFGTNVEIIEPFYLKEELLKYIKKIEKHFET